MIPACLWDERVTALLQSWINVKYKLYGTDREGIDCVRFVCVMLDTLYGFSRGPLDKLPPDTAFHNKRGAVRGMRKIIKRYRPNRALEIGEQKETGDVMVVAPDMHSGPGHAVFVAPNNQLIHATSVGIKCAAHWQCGPTVRVFRVLDKERWLC